MWNVALTNGRNHKLPQPIASRMESIISKIEPIILNELKTNGDILAALNAIHSLALNINILAIESMVLMPDSTRDFILEYKDAQFDLLDLYKDQLNTEVLRVLKKL